MSVRFRFAVSILIAGQAMSAPVDAATVEDAPSIAVHFNDLDLKTDTGVAKLQQRIGRAAAQACGSFDIRDLKRVAAVNECRKYALTNASAEVELAVAAAHRGEGYASSAMPINVRSR